MSTLSCFFLCVHASNSRLRFPQWGGRGGCHNDNELGDNSVAPSLPELCCCPCHLHSPAWCRPRQSRAVPAPSSAVPRGAVAALVQPAVGCRGRGGALIQQCWLSGAAADGTGGVSTGLWRCPMIPTRTPGRGRLKGAGRVAEKLSGHPGQGQHGLQCLPARGPELSGEIHEGQTR